MFSSSLAAALGRRDIHYGWVVAAVTFLTMLVTAGAVGAPGVFIVPLQEEFGWQTAEISSALAIRLALGWQADGGIIAQGGHGFQRRRRRAWPQK